MKRDPGLQPQRTCLAWGRTVFSFWVCALLLLRAGVVERNFSIFLVGSLQVVAAASMSIGLRVRRESLADGSEYRSPHAGFLKWAACIGVCSTLAGFLVVLENSRFF